MTLENKKILQSLYSFIKPYRKWFILGSLLNFMLVLFNLLRTFFTERLLDNAMGNEASGSITYLLLLTGITGVALVALYGGNYYTGRFGLSVVRDIKYALFKGLSNSKISEIDKFNIGDIISRNNSEMRLVQVFLQTRIPKLLYQPLMFFAASIYMIYIDWRLYLICYSLSPISVMLINKFNKKSVKYSKEYYENLSKANGVIKECIDGVTTIKTYNLSHHIVSNCKSAFDKVIRSVLQSEKYDAIQLPFYFIIYESPKILCLLFGGLAVINQRMSLGELIAYSQLILFVADPINTLSTLFGNIRKFFVAFKRIDQLLDLPIENCESTKINQAINPSADLAFRNVSFSYDHSKNVLKDISFDIPMGKKVAIVGLSGEGKTTLLNLISGLYSGNEGEILINDKPYSQLDIAEIRSNISYVSQDTYLFPISVRDNIALGTENTSDEAVQKVAQISKCHDFISKMPDQYNTVISEKGKSLSGGQRQRLAIARALIKNAPIILMDEPTAALDLQTEADVMEDIFDIAENKTVIISTHRYSTIKKVDMIIVLSEGRIVESGTHHQLMDLDGIYSRLYNRQFSLREVI